MFGLSSDSGKVLVLLELHILRRIFGRQAARR